MNNKVLWFVVGCVLVLSMLVTSCAPEISGNPTETQTTTPTTSHTTTKPTNTTPTTTAPTTSTPAGPEMATITLKKLDGSTITKQIEKPQYGGQLTLMRAAAIIGWDEGGYVTSWGGAENLDLFLQEMVEGDWSRGAGGTDEVTWQMNMWFDRNYMKGSLAESWEIKPPDTIILHIRKGVRWSLNPALEASRLVGGRELTADDIVFNLKRIFFEIKTSGGYGVAGPSRPVDAYATDANTVVVKSAVGQIWPCFQYVVDWIRIYPPEVIKKYGDANVWDRAIGTEAFMLTDYVPMSSVTYVRNPNYWQKDPVFPENQLPYIDSVKLLIIPDPSTRMSAMRTGKVDASDMLLWEDATSLKKTNPELKYTKILGGVVLPAGRMDKTELPFKDIRVRRALMMAINQDEIKNTFYGGEAEILAYPVAPIKEWIKGYTPLDQLGLAPDGFDTKKIYEYHPDEARQLLAEAGYPNGFKTEAAINAATVGAVDLASIYKAYWAKIGVELTLDVKESTVWTAMQVRKTHKEILWGGYANTSLPEGMWPDRTGNAFNWAMPNDAEVDRRYDLMASLEPRTDEWWKVVKDNNLYLVHRVHYFPAPQAYNWRFWQPWVKSYHGEVAAGVNNTQKWTKYAWIDQELKRSMGH